MSETLPTQEHDPHFDEAAANIAASLERVMERYQDFVDGDSELELVLYKLSQSGVYEPSTYNRLHLSRELDLTDNPDTTETVGYHLWISNERTNTISADMNLTLSLRGNQEPSATLNKGSIHIFDNALHNLIEVKGL